LPSLNAEFSVRILRSTAVRLVAAATVTCAAVAARSQTTAQDPARTSPQFRFNSRVDLVNVTVTVSDAAGRFVPDLKKDDFTLYEDDEPQDVSLFFSERVPVSLGIAIDTSGSMQGEKFAAARDALDRFLGELLDPADEILLYRFDDEVQLLQGWTTSRDLLRRALGRISPRGATTLYDAVAAAVPIAQTGSRRKKALVVISDGNDTSSHTTVPELKQMIRETEVLVYAIGIDGQAEPAVAPRPPRFPLPMPIPGRGGRAPFPPGRAPVPPQPPPGPAPGPVPITPRPDARVNVLALRELTDESGGRTETIRTVIDLDPATAGVANELSRQYYLGYQSPSAGDGKWHALRVEVRDRTFHVRARSGFTATPAADTAKRHPCP
jgi:Ca-activated chloride channel family protein